ncbi:MAG: zinc dependent phospholipase C family protein [Clostridiales bacterium]|jgi:hypothetical protein|nr:zinc dependent phospholipase C family protein [Clostridiales bacterium]
MPGLISHYLCADITANSQKTDKELIGTINSNREIYNIGAQGPDVFFYYLPGLIRQKTRGLGSEMHKSGFGEFFKTACLTIKKMPDGAEKNAAIAYVCGYLTHYALDCAAHPYIYYKSGFRKKGTPIKNIKHTMFHRRLETNIDTLLLKILTDMKPSDKKLWQLLYAKKRTKRPVSGFLSNCIKEAYGTDISTGQVSSAMGYMSFVTRIIQSKTGKRKRVIEAIEDATASERIVSCMIHENNITDGIDYLNVAKKPWFKPWDAVNEITSSFCELFDEGVKNATELIQMFYSYCTGNYPLEQLLKFAGDRSFASGVEEEVLFDVYDVIF